MRYRFGSLILITEQRVLFDGETRVPLAPKTFDILQLLLQSAGEVVNRDTLRQRVWEGAYVDEAVVSRNLSLLRLKLRPFFGETEVVETISKRGYRFLIPVEILESKPEGESSSAPAENLEEVTLVPDLAPAVTTEVEHATPAKRSHRSLFGWAALLAAFALLAVTGYRIRRSENVHAEQNQLAVLDFRDLSDSSSAGWVGVALQESLSQALSRDGGLTTVEGDRVAVAQEDLGLLHARKLEASELDQLDKRLGVAYLLTGTYMPVGEQIRLDLILHKGDKAVSEFSDTVEQADLQAAVVRASAQMRDALRLPKAQTGGELQYFGKDQVAAHYYAEGLKLSWTGDAPRQAREAFSKAVEADPHFAEAHEALAVAWGRIGHAAESRAEAQLALDTCGPLPETRRLDVQAAAYRQLRNYPKSLEAMTQLRKLHPDDQSYKLRMAVALLSSNRLSEATDLLRGMEMDKTHPPNLEALTALMRSLAGQGDKKAQFVYADKIMKLARAEGSRSGEALAHMYAGRGWSAAGDGPKAVEEFQQAGALSGQVGDTSNATLALQNESATRIKFHMYGGMEVGQRALDRAAEAGQDGTVAEMCINLGSAALDASLLRSALSYYKRAFELGGVIQSKHMQQIALESLVNAYLRAEQLPEAEKQNALELQYAHDIGTPVEVAGVVGQRAQIESYLGKWNAAEASFKEALAILQKAGAASDANELLVDYSRMLLGRGDVTRARQIFASVNRVTLVDNASLARYVEARIAFESGDLGKAEALGSAALAKESVPAMSSVGLDLLEQIAVRQKDAAKARVIAERYAALAQSIPEDGAVRRGAVRAGAEAEIQAGNRNGTSVREMPQIMREASALHHAEEVAEDEHVLATSRR